MQRQHLKSHYYLHLYYSAQTFTPNTAEESETLKFVRPFNRLRRLNILLMAVTCYRQNSLLH